MKKIIIFCMSVVLLISQVSASDSITAHISESKIEMGEPLILEIFIDTSASLGESYEVHVPGIENFEVFSQSQGSSFQSINGQTTSQRRYTFDIRPLNTGKFSLGPITLKYDDTQEISDDEIFDITVEDSSVSQVLNLSQQDAGGYNMNEKNTEEIKGDRTAIFPFFGWIALGGIFLSLFYLFLQYVLFGNKKDSHENIGIPPKESFDEEIRKYFQKLEEKNSELESQRFFRAYNIGIRKIFSHKGLKDAQTATLKEIKKYFKESDDAIFELFKKSYEYEYSGKSKTVATRKKYIEKILALL